MRLWALPWVFVLVAGCSGGLKYRISQLFAWRFDVRGYDTARPNWNGVLHNQGSLLQQFEASVGIGVYF